MSFPPNEQQWRIIRETTDHLLVSAGAGTGKTTTVVDHILYLIGVPVDGECAAEPIPLRDIAAITYEVSGDVQVVRVESPPTAQPGQTVTVRVVLEATTQTTGTLHLRREGQPIDLNGLAPGSSRRIRLPAGRSVQLAQVTLGETPINRFEATFEADDPAADALLVNNRADSFTATPGRGTVLVLDRRGDPTVNLLSEALRQAGVPTEVLLPQALGEDLLSFQRYDLIILDNVAAFELNGLQQKLLSRYVHDLGGGLIMVGGEQSFGAGGWNGTDVEDVLPLELDPPKELHAFLRKRFRTLHSQFGGVVGKQVRIPKLVLFDGKKSA